MTGTQRLGGPGVPRGIESSWGRRAGAIRLLRAAIDPNAVGGALYMPRWLNWGPPVRRRCLVAPGTRTPWSPSGGSQSVRPDRVRSVAAVTPGADTEAPLQNRVLRGRERRCA